MQETALYALAKKIASADRSPNEVATLDQISAAWRNVLATDGLNIDDEVVAKTLLSASSMLVTMLAHYGVDNMLIAIISMGETAALHVAAQ